MASTPGKKAIAIHWLPNISRRKDNQTIKFGQLIEYIIKNIFLEIIHKIKWRSYSQGLFGNIKIVEGYQSILKLSWKSIVFTSCKAFLNKLKEVWNYSPCLTFCMIFKEKCFSCDIPLNDQISLPCCLYFVRYWAICVL